MLAVDRLQRLESRAARLRVSWVGGGMAVTQLGGEARARTIFDDARARGHTKKEALRILKRRPSDVVGTGG